MSIVKKLISFIKSIFSNQETIELISAPKQEIQTDNKTEFINSLKVDNITKERKITKKKIQTLICPGDGLGIQGKISY